MVSDEGFTSKDKEDRELLENSYLSHMGLLYCLFYVSFVKAARKESTHSSPSAGV